MKALILAAGFGSRLMPLTAEMPKSLVPVNGRPILLKQLDNLMENGLTEGEITIISGYQATALEQAVHAAYPGVRILENREYADTNNMYSAYLARELLDGEDFLMMNADVFFDASVIRALLDFPQPNGVVTDVGRYLEESMKVVEENGRLKSISKAIPPEEALGASIDVYKFSAQAGTAFFAKCAEYIQDKGQRGLWSEIALDGIFSQVPFAACPLQGRWLEIDTPEDLAQAEALFAQ